MGPPFLTGWVVFYTRRLYQRIEDCWNRPIAGEASARIQARAAANPIPNPNPNPNHDRNPNPNPDPSPTPSPSPIQICVRERKGRGDGAPLEMTGEKRDLLNLGSYNYLGFGGVDERCVSPTSPLYLPYISPISPL